MDIIDKIRVIMSALNRIVSNRRDAVLDLSARWLGMVFLTAISLGVIYLWLHASWTPENAIDGRAVVAFASQS